MHRSTTDSRVCLQQWPNQGHVPHTVEKQHEDTSPSPFWVLLQVHFSRTEQSDPVISVSLQVNTVCCVTKIYSTAALLQAQNIYLPSPLLACTLVVCVRKSEPISFYSTCKKMFLSGVNRTTSPCSASSIHYIHPVF